ncbi:SsgA family sporulation/cell division regulator [Streptomyces armeniacus]|uniref:SsgA family sporulation/cell division regulator n=1 Tax=Streptomyces armeniacus TaxID=83291 RepID=A0A345XR82_9ACTN|nr:SsgA family sporulation/cell division regulator [Streptomyces armeniacus]AXK34148.1 SsgA family sporulation/cell division regulator [Streptomyces armeniacus]
MDSHDDREDFAVKEPERPGVTSVTASWELSLILSAGWAVPLQARFHYCAADPYAVRLDFYLDTARPVRWIFARDLLTAGLARPTGRGDVRVWPVPDRALVSLRLVSEHGDALFTADAAPLTAWLERTCQLVPPGQEFRFFDLDMLLDRLLSEP